MAIGRALLPAVLASRLLQQAISVATGIALASLGESTQAIEQFKQAVNVEPHFDEARRNLALGLRSRR